VFEQEAADLIDNGCPLSNKPAANPVHGLHVKLIGALQWYETHGRPLHRFSNSFGIPVIVFVAFQEGLHVLRGDQADVVAERSQMSAKMMRPGASLHSDQARRQIGQSLSELMA
jgi:hypothetical protein